MKKIEALQKTIYNLENNVYEYNWTDFDACNCGVVARTIMDGTYSSEAGFHNSQTIDTRLTAFACEAFCMTTGLPLPRVFQELKDVGFTHQDILELENLGNHVILKKLGWRSFESFGRFYWVVCNDAQRNNKNDLITYLKAWIEILLEQMQYPELSTVTVEDIIKEALTV